SWILRPAEGASGIQDLRIEVWITQFNLDGRIEYLDIPDAQYPLRIEIVPAGGVSPLLLALIIGGVVLVGGFMLLRRGWGVQKTVSAISTPGTAPTATRVPMVFISYRRGSSWGQARSIEQSLRKRGANVFIDVDDINEGKFAETIQKAIADCDFFLPVLAPGTLDSIWVRREIAHAIQLKKTIVPLLVDGFALDEASVPPDITEIASHNAIRVLPEFYEEAMDRLAKRFLRLE
ncbi:MAG: toll/interleukin-1 receptor domain-containing protein, partial [Anaerolineae bacterium]|nr:toll/interleukin-1 receptor domain-containing protein [Anaerolineae bacterium]